MSDQSFSGESGQRADSVSGRDSTYQTELWGFKPLVGVEARICKRLPLSCLGAVPLAAKRSDTRDSFRTTFAGRWCVWVSSYRPSLHHVEVGLVVVVHWVEKRL